MARRLLSMIDSLRPIILPAAGRAQPSATSPYGAHVACGREADAFRVIRGRIRMSDP